MDLYAKKAIFEVLKYKTMRKSLLLLLLLGIVVLATNAQKKLVVIEEFTNSGCGPCAAFAPVLDNVVNNRLCDVIAIKYHGSYPNPKDPFLLENKVDIQQREQFYSINSYPTTLYNGIRENHSTNDYMLNSLIDKYLYQEEIIKMDLSKTFVDYNNVKFNIDIKPLKKIELNNLRLIVVMLEEYIKLDEPFPNGETEVKYTMRRMLPNADGEALPLVMEEGEVYSYEMSSDMYNFYDTSELGAVALVQDYNTKEVIASAYLPKDPKYQHQLSITGVVDIPSKVCVPEFYGRVALRNDGENTIKSAKLHVSVNGMEKVYDYKRNLGYLERDTFEITDFPEFQIDKKYNTVKVYVSNINEAYENESFFEYSTGFFSSTRLKGGALLKLYTDNKPEEISWVLYNSAGDVVQKSAKYDKARKIYKESLLIDKDDCYTIEFYDEGGDGIKGDFGNGYYILYEILENGKTKQIVAGDYETKYHTLNFYLEEANAALGIENVNANENAIVEIYDCSGNYIDTVIGKNLNKKNLERYSNDVLILKINNGNTVETQKILINK